MKKVFILALVIVFALVVLVLAGCGQSKEQASSSAPASISASANGGDSAGDTRVSFIDVGKGDCILLQAGKSSALIDTGYDSTTDDVLAYLEEQGVSHLDYLIVTHYDHDHVGGLGAIGKAIDIGKVFLPGYEGSDKNCKTAMAAVEDLGLNAQRVTETQHLKLGDDELSIFPSSVEYDPESEEGEGNDNDLSLVTTLTGKDASYLFTGDIEEEGIAAYLEGDHGQFDILKMPHHGRKAPGTEELLERTKPKIAIITDSEDKPAEKKTLKQLEEAGVDVHRASKSGTIVVRGDGAGGYSISG